MLIVWIALAILVLTMIGACYSGRKAWIDFSSGRTTSAIVGTLSALGAIGVIAWSVLFFFIARSGGL